VISCVLFSLLFWQSEFFTNIRRDVSIFVAMLNAYQVKDKKQAPKNAFEIYGQNMELVEETRNLLLKISNGTILS
jgi:hypothetical protein